MRAISASVQEGFSRKYGDKGKEVLATVVGFFVRFAFEKLEPLKSYLKIDQRLRILLGDAYFSHLPEYMRIDLIPNFFSDAILDSSIVDKLRNQPEKEGWLATVHPTLEPFREQG